jgi:hypothetical protein
MKNFNTTIATLSIAAAGLFIVSGVAKADSAHFHPYSHLPHSHKSHGHGHGTYHQPHQGQNLGSAIVIGGLLLGGIALFDALQDQDRSYTTGYPHYVQPKPKPKPAPVLPVTYTSHCQDHGHIGITLDAPHVFSLRRPSGSKLVTIEADRSVLYKVADALDRFHLDTTCVIRTSSHGVQHQTRFFLSNGRLARVPAHWSGADKIVTFNPDTLSVDRVHSGKYQVERPDGKVIAGLPTRAAARAFIAYLDDMQANKKVVIQDRYGDNKFAFYAR